MTAAFDDRAIVAAQNSLRSIAYTGFVAKDVVSDPRTRKRQQKWDQVIDALSGDTVVTESLTFATVNQYRVSGNEPEILAERWEDAAKQRIVGSGIASAVIWQLFWSWVFPLLVDLAKRWLNDQLLNQTTVTITSRITKEIP